MNSPLHFRFLVDYVESAARKTPSVLYSDSRSFWDDLLETYNRREEKRNYWIFCSRWVREALTEIMNTGSARALEGILRVLKPEARVQAPETEAGKRRTIAHLLPILLKETLTRVKTASDERYGEHLEDMPPSYHPGEM